MASNIIAQIIASEGLTVKDGTKPIIVTVKKCDTQAKGRKNPEYCVFAQACKRQFRDLKRAVFLRSMAYLQTGKTLTRFRINNAVQKEIFAYDRGGKVEEGEYILNAISPSDNLLHKRQHSKRIASGKAKKRGTLAKRHIAGNIRVAHFNGKHGE